MSKKFVAIAPFLRSNNKVATLGIRAALGDYSQQERDALLSADLILFPTARFAKIFESARKSTFPGSFTYSIQKFRLIREVMFQFLGCPHPRTHIYYGRQKLSIAQNFRFPFQAAGPSAIHRFRQVADAEALEAVVAEYNPLIIREEEEYERRFRLTFINYECVCIHECIPASQSDHCEPAHVERFATQILSELQSILRTVHIDDIAVHVGLKGRTWKVTDMSRPPVSWISSGQRVTRHEYISKLIDSGRL